MRRKRNDVTIELRKALRDEQLTKHRNVVIDNHEEVNVELNLDYEMTVDNIKEGKNNKFSLVKLLSSYFSLVFY